MKNKIVIVSVIAVFSILGFGAFIKSQNSSQSDSMMKKDEAKMPNEKTSLEPTNAMMKQNASIMEGEKMEDKMTDPRYVQYSKSVLDTASKNRRVLFFYASWCPTCKPADANFTQNESSLPTDVTLIRVNYNDPETDQEEKELAKKYGITYQHTFVQIDGAGKEITKWNGGQIDELLSNIK